MSRGRIGKILAVIRDPDNLVDRSDVDEIDLNAFAVAICRRERGKREMDIAQTKETIRCIADELLDKGPAKATAVLVKLLAQAEARKKRRMSNR